MFFVVYLHISRKLEAKLESPEVKQQEPFVNLLEVLPILNQAVSCIDVIDEIRCFRVFAMKVLSTSASETGESGPFEKANVCVE